NRRLLIQIESVPEVPRLDAFVPVAAEVCDVAVFLSDDDEFQLVHFAGITRRAWRNRHAVGPGNAAPLFSFVDRRDERHAGAWYRLAVVETRDEHKRVLRAVLDVDPKIRHLDDG